MWKKSKSGLIRQGSKSWKTRQSLEFFEKVGKKSAKLKKKHTKLGNVNARGGKGRKRAEGAGSPSVQVEVIDQETGMKTIYCSMSAVGKALGVASGSIRMYFSSNTQKPYPPPLEGLEGRGME